MGEEASCFGSRQGWVVMMIGFPIMVVVTFIHRANHIFNSLGFSVLLFMLSLTGRKLKQKIISSCTMNI